ncbi:hypothetical protein [Aureispira anguillae]|uniref:Uncharacterized protein n=1 Tax=Aureispira anguillae TaxID=2864201 RepID=A0A915YKS3_9BACT|nr:hypothetical protein [Aureispira anguillae]BDS14761.1 hypothetical protein AsAng_0055430 [Aureispira anguillae]
MPVKSYLVTPVAKRQKALVKELSRMDGCEVLPSTNHELIVLITDTGTTLEEKLLLDALKELQHIKDISLVSGYDI